MSIDVRTRPTAPSRADQRTARARTRAVPMVIALPVTALLSVLVGVLSLGLAPHGSLVGALVVDDPAGWALVAVVLVLLSGQQRTIRSASLGLVSFVGLDVGWYLVGGGALSASAIFWYAVAVLAGPPVGAAAGWSRSTGPRGAVGGGALAGLLVGDAVVSLRLLGNVPEAAALVVLALGAVGLTAALLHARTASARFITLGACVGTAVLYGVVWSLILRGF